MGAGEGGAQRRYLVPIHAPPHLRHEVGPARAAQRPAPRGRPRPPPARPRREPPQARGPCPAQL